MLDDHELINQLTETFGSPLYVFNEQAFVENYKALTDTFRMHYENYHIAYSFKTNYAPYIASVVKNHGGYAEVVSGMEYYIAKKIGYKDQNIIFNGPNKGDAGKEAFLNGCILNVDNLDEVQTLSDIAKQNADKSFEIGIRINIDVGQDFISRFGVDISELSSVFEIAERTPNLKVVGLHCHISRCRGLNAWAARTQKMLELADKYFEIPPKYIDLGSGMFGSMDPEFAAQFDNVPSYEEYANVVAKEVYKHYRHCDAKPKLFTEPGTTLINKFIDFIGRVDAIKCVRGKNIAIMNCSEHNLGETCTLKQLPMQVVKCSDKKEYTEIDITGYTCLEQDVMRKNYTGKIAVGDYVVFGNVGGYSNVLKPPFIWPNCKMVAVTPNKEFKIIKNAETYDDILSTYVF